MSVILAIATWIVRGWTRLYTLRMPAAEQTARREAIDSDVWEQLHDAPDGGDLRTALHLLGRTVCGVPDDLRWRVEYVQNPSLRYAALALTVLAIVVVAILSSAGALPPLPRAEAPAILILDTPPPPPPPPPEKQGGRHDREYWRSRP